MVTAPSKKTSQCVTPRLSKLKKMLNNQRWQISTNNWRMKRHSSKNSQEKKRRKDSGLSWKDSSGLRWKYRSFFNRGWRSTSELIWAKFFRAWSIATSKVTRTSCVGSLLESRMRTREVKSASIIWLGSMSTRFSSVWQSPWGVLFQSAGWTIG